MSLPVISIITPSYNQVAYLEQTIRSVLEQNYPQIEYMVVDGESTDCSVDIIRKYDGRLAWWVSEADSGQADAINKGFARASGEIVAWLNSDDYYLPNTIPAVMELFAKHPEAGLIYGDVLSVDGEGNPINIQCFQPYTLDDMMAFKIISQPAVFMRRSILEKAGYLDPSYHFLLDHHLWLRMVQLAPLVYSPQILAAARYHDDAKNISHAEQFGGEAFKILEWVEAQPGLAERLLENKPEIMAGAHHLNAFYLVEAGKMRAGLIAYYHAYRYHPRTVYKAWKRIIYAFFSLIGLGRVREIYLRFKQNSLKKETCE